MASFIHRFRVRFHECDASGIVFNANHITYVDVALTEMWREGFGSYADLSASGVDIVVADVHARFLRPVTFDEQVELRLEIESFGRTSMTSRWETRVDGERRVEGTIVHVWVDSDTGRPVEPPPSVRESLERFSVRP